MGVNVWTAGLNYCCKGNGGKAEQAARMMKLCCAESCLLIGVLLRAVMAEGDSEVSCVLMERCILPCSFHIGKEIVIHWFKTAGDLRVHSFYYSNNEFGHQDQRFRKRTSLFKDQISRGNASLQLTGVQVQDQGRYKCQTSTIRGNQDSFVNLKVDAPVNEVNIDQVKNRITCSSEGIYPEPQLTWSTSPPSNITFTNTTTVQQTEQLLYSIKSSLILSDCVYDLLFICTISTHRSRRRATLRQLGHHINVAAIITAVGFGIVLISLLIAALIYYKRRKVRSQHVLRMTNSRTIPDPPNPEFVPLQSQQTEPTDLEP